eukprot:NODE_2294_length_2245_cov_9.914070.p1 GENE.NODE_2294_length_2245_cov_9.914070~~NODE_2294_length_2245_cov_9.914070.p1  ORF type:complete len:728 (+),score=171.90 NODE_2294_length_2245_cov_9.914070:87-2186(+)
MIQRVRAEFKRCCQAGIYAVSAEGLAQHCLQLAEEHNRSVGAGLLSLQDKQLIALRVAQMVQQMDLNAKGSIDVCEWVHFMLLRHTGASCAQINSILRLALRRDPDLLEDLQQVFEEADLTSSCLLSIADVAEMYSQNIWHLRPNNSRRSSSEEKAENLSAEQLALEIIAAMDLDGDDHVSYAEFMAYCLGRRKSEVTLHLYDISRGAMQAVSLWLLGRHVEGLWHSGLVVFGKEYFFSGDAVHDSPGQTIFGNPAKIVPLGNTLWSEGELHRHIVHELKPRFNRETYDAVGNNCNHFTDRLCQYLLGKNLPDEVVRQPEILLSSGAAHLLRPILNKWLRTGIGRHFDAKLDDIPLPGEGDSAEGSSSHNKPMRPGTTVTFTLGPDDGMPIVGVICSSQATHSGSSHGPGSASSSSSYRREAHTVPAQLISGGGGGGRSFGGCGATAMCSTCGCVGGSGPSASSGGASGLSASRVDVARTDSGRQLSLGEARVRYFDLNMSVTHRRLDGRMCSNVMPESKLLPAPADRLVEHTSYLEVLRVLVATPPTHGEFGLGSASIGLQPQRSLRPDFPVTDQASEMDQVSTVSMMLPARSPIVPWPADGRCNSVPRPIDSAPVGGPLSPNGSYGRLPVPPATNGRPYAPATLPPAARAPSDTAGKRGGGRADSERRLTPVMARTPPPLVSTPPSVTRGASPGRCE